FNLFGPSTLGGDLVRALYLGAGYRRRLAISSVVFDRASGLVVLVALGALGFLLFPRYRFPPSLILGAVAVGGALVVGWWAAPRLVRLLPATRRTRELRRDVEVDLSPLWRHRRLPGGAPACRACPAAGAPLPPRGAPASNEPGVAA